MKMGLFKVDGVSLPVMYADSAAPTPDGVTVADHDMWRALDLVVRRYAIGEAIAADHYGKAQRLTRQYVDAAGLALR